ncbi:ATP-binding cassette domain-containing protein [Phytoactinopolyspora mesophila]|uniref:ATP-binding cassette domain-containing protein n=1 Tax=Phytoactinopolyspora mesophila TaxID=2650750 RepID=A0A7K3M3A1_9ACTN|nr:ATP-binding cassette domain-containing protein [Phytoactinopolyspora mesophila]NDL56928.1 ATP-binding cassette domain-containing protein [Phytoactinopolyspora mesophila]
MTAPTVLGTHIEVRGLTVRYKKRAALDGLDLDLDAGVHGLLGPNGAGKTTLMRVLATVAKPTSGRVALLGHDLSDQRALRVVRRRLGYLPQHFGYYPRFTVREFVEYFAWLKEMPGSTVPLAVDHAIERVGLADRADERLKRLSGGMLRRAGIAQAIVNSPDILLLDEPTAGLDPEQRVDFRQLLRSIGVDTCVLVATHLVEDVAAACSEVTLANGGRVVFRGTPDELAGHGDGAADGDSPIERGYTAVLRADRAR